MSYQERSNALLMLIESDRVAKRDAIVTEARNQAHAVLAEAHRRAREQMRTAYAVERRRADARVGAARAQLQTRLRLAHRARDHRWLEEASGRLPAALQSRWRDVNMRAGWVNRTMDDALRHLPAGAWRIEHAPDWPRSERDAIADRLAERGITVMFSEREDMGAGLRVGMAGSVIDASVEGLLSDRDEIAARLLATLESAS